MPRWAEFEGAAAPLAGVADELLRRFRFLLLATIRRDGTPRISPVEARLVRGELMLALIPGSLKVRDLERDPRLVLNTPVVRPDDPHTVEVKLRGRGLEIADPELRRATADAVEAQGGWRPPPDWRFVAVDVQDVAVLRWDDGRLHLERWTPAGGIVRTTRAVAVLGD